MTRSSDMSPRQRLVHFVTRLEHLEEMKREAAEALRAGFADAKVTVETDEIGPVLNEITSEATYPSVELAFQFVIPSYQMIASRFEAADGRLTSLLTMASSLTLAAPIFAKSVNPSIPFNSRWFAAGMTCFFLSIVVGLVGRLRGVLTLPNPSHQYNKTLHLSPWEFRQQAIYFAGQHFNANVKAVAVKGRTSLVLTFLLAAEIALLVVWVSGR